MSESEIRNNSGLVENSGIGSGELQRNSSGLESRSGSVNNSGLEEQWVGGTAVVAGEPEQQRRGDVVIVAARVPTVGVSTLLAGQHSCSTDSSANAGCDDTAESEATNAASEGSGTSDRPES